MSNYLKVSMQETINSLYEKGWSRRRIARELEVNRRTVKKYILNNHSKCTISTTGSSVEISEKDASKCTISTTGSPTGGRQSLCFKFSDYILRGLEKNLTAQRIYQDLVSTYGFTGSYQSVKRYVKKLSNKLELPFRRMETSPWKEVQVDYGTGGWIYDKDGKRKKTHLFRIVLSCSRKGYSEVTETQDTESFLRSLENAFLDFGGVPETIVIDNLKAGVLKPSVYDPDLNPKLRDFSKHYNCCILPTKVTTPRHKGKIENSVKYVQDNALKGHKFTSLHQQNDFLQNWEKKIADTRIHGTVRKQVKRMFEDEKPFLNELPASLFPVFKEAVRKVHRDGYVEVARAYYSVPAEYVRREVWVRYNLRTVKVFNRNMEEIAMHCRSEAGKFNTHSYHIPAEKISNVERGNKWLLKQADFIGGNAGAWARAMLRNKGIPGTRVLNGLLQLADKYTAFSIDSACKTALETGSFRLKELKGYIEKIYEAEQMKFDFLDEHPLIREMSDYENLTNTKEVFHG